MFTKKSIIIWIAILVIFIYWYKKRYFDCTNLWSNFDPATKTIFFEEMNKVDNNPTLKEEIENKAADNSRSYDSQKVFYASQFIVEKKIITDLDRRNIIKCLA